MNKCVVLCVSGLCASAATAQVELYRQNQSPSPGGYSSQEARNPGGLGWFSEVADDFVSQAGWTINNVKFWGGYVTPPGQPGNTQGFVIRFYTDNNGRPGTELFEQDVVQFNETEYAVLGGFAAYSYSCNLSPAFTPPSPGVYWFSTVAILDRGAGSPEPQWGINQSFPINGASGMQWFFSPGNFTSQNTDYGMVLSGTIGTTSCYANCDGSTGSPVLTANDFQCFANAFAAGSSSANCDGSTGTPSLTANDFQCFANAYAAGCS